MDGTEVLDGHPRRGIGYLSVGEQGDVDVHPSVAIIRRGKLVRETFAKGGKNVSSRRFPILNYVLESDLPSGRTPLHQKPKCSHSQVGEVGGSTG